MDTNLSKLWETVKDREGLACRSPWGHKELDTTERLNNMWEWGRGQQPPEGSRREKKGQSQLTQ